MQLEFHRCPLTALCCLASNGTVLAGSGHHLEVHNEDTFRSIKIFEDQAVHGIIVTHCETTAVIWGGRCLRRARLSVSGQDVEITLDEPQHIDDWILDAAFAPRDSNGSITTALVTAHNALWTACIRVPSSTFELNFHLEREIAGSNSILYSAHLKWLTASHCLVASGTAFGDVIIWSAFRDATFDSHEMHFAFSAHEGSVFGVQISSMLRLGGRHEGDEVSEKRLLATCSDDRTIRVWDISYLNYQGSEIEARQRDTGFGGGTHSTGVHAPMLFAKVVSHTSRIWHVRFQDSVGEEDTNPKPRLLSCGEDAFANTWRLEPSPTGLPYALKQIDAKSAHAGKHIWAVAQCQSGEVVTGGADGAIMRHPPISSRDPVVEIDRGLLPGASGRRDNYKAYTFVSERALVSTTEQGRVLLVEVEGTTHRMIELLGPTSGLQSYSVVARIGYVAFIGGTDGVIYVYDHGPSQGSPQGSVTELARREGKIAGLFAASIDSKNICLVATGVAAEEASLYIVPHAALQTPSNDGILQLRMNLPVAAVVTSLAVRTLGSTTYIFLGMREGDIAVYTMTDEISGDAPLTARHVAPVAHGKESVTAIITKMQPSQKSGQLEKLFLMSTGRDGTLAIRHLVTERLDDDEPEPPYLVLMHQLSLPFGPNIEGLFLSPLTGYLRVWGFRGKRFVHYNATAQRETLSVECGGAHRNWAFNSEPQRSVWTKVSRVHTYSREAPSTALSTIKAGGHGREIKAIAVSSHFRCGEIIATGAEDTDIKLFLLTDSGFECLQTLRKHVTGVQHLAWDGEYLFSSGGFEEFFVWKVTDTVPHFRIGVFCESEKPKKEDSDLRICGFHVRRSTEVWLQRKGEVAFEVTMAYSDSSVKMWRYTTTTDGSKLKGAVKRWNSQERVNYLTACLTTVLRPTKNVIATAATDGHLVLWSSKDDDGANQKLRWVLRHRMHQNAIQAATSARLTGTSILFVTGGDDNAIAVARLFPPSSLTEESTILIPRAHAAAITGLALVPIPAEHNEERAGAFWLVSAGIDQRVKLWRVYIDVKKRSVEGVEIKKVQDVWTPVADVSSLEVIRRSDGNGHEETVVVVVGVGMGVLRLPAPR